MPELKRAGQTTDEVIVLGELIEKSKVYRQILYCWAEAGLPFQTVMHQVARDYVAAAISIEKGNKCKAAARLGMHRNSLSRRAGSREEK